MASTPPPQTPMTPAATVSPTAPPAPAKPERDWVDYTLFAIQVAGLIAVVVTIVITLRTNASSDKDTARALTTFSSLAKNSEDQKNALVGQVSVLRDQVKAVQDTASSTRDLVENSNQQLNTSINALKLQGYSQVAMRTVLDGYNAVDKIQGFVGLRNTGGPIIHNAQVSAAAMLGPTDRPELIFTYLSGALPTSSRLLRDVQRVNPVTLVAGDDQSEFRVKISSLNETNVRLINQGSIALFIAGTIRYTDAAGERHVRHICEYYTTIDGTFQPDTCATPPQR